ncbi:unnamed protein product [Schistosoma mattheei]|uniref:Uncharacterized protein n=1 Tax=Schistosoma mattheei TaxID=31246 RepID=A0A3P8H730_9TREM|nr:unnamed protein product [Schistosoma mattheei]
MKDEKTFCQVIPLHVRRSHIQNVRNPFENIVFPSSKPDSVNISNRLNYPNEEFLQKEAFRNQHNQLVNYLDIIELNIVEQIFYPQLISVCIILPTTVQHNSNILSDHTEPFLSNYNSLSIFTMNIQALNNNIILNKVKKPLKQNKMNSLIRGFSSAAYKYICIEL